MFEKELVCPKCNKNYKLNSWLDDNCGYRLRIKYDKESRKNSVSKDKIKSKPISHWKYKNFFPVKDDKNIISIGEGGTSLVKSNRISEDFGLNQLYFKLELTNPSGSFKDRPISVGASVGKEQNTKVLSAASSGNAAASLASFGAKAGINTVVFVPNRSSQSKVSQLITLGATVVRVSPRENQEGDPSVQLFQESVKKWGWTPCPSFGPFNPFQFEGTKSLGFEIVEQLDWVVPDWIICNTGSGGLLSGTYEGFKDWHELHWIEKLPRMVAVQPEACAPVVKAFHDRVKPLEFEAWQGFPETVAGGLADPHPWDGDSALEALYESKGTAITVNDHQILEYQRILASKEGIFAEPSGVAALAGLNLLIYEGTIDKNDLVVVPITGHGLKDPQVLQDRYSEAIVSPPDINVLETKLKGKNKKLF